MNREDLYRSFNNIDDDILERSEANKKRLSYTWKKWGAIAACLCILVIGAISILNNQSGIEMESQMVVHLVGSVVENNAGILTYHTDNYSEHVMGFTLVKKNDMEMYIRFDGYIIKNEWTDEDGVHQEVEEYVAMSPYDDYEQQPNRTLINDALVITVNGVETNVLPTEPGTYEISVYYGELYNRLDVISNEVEILGFGHFMIDCEDFEEQHPDLNKGE